MVTDYIHKRRAQPGLISFGYNLLPKLLPDWNALHGPGIRFIFPGLHKFSLCTMKMAGNFDFLSIYLKWWNGCTGWFSELFWFLKNLWLCLKNETVGFCLICHEHIRLKREHLCRGRFQAKANTTTKVFIKLHNKKATTLVVQR